MSVSDATRQTLIIRRVGDILPTTLAPTTAATGLLAVNVPLLWDYYGTETDRVRDLDVERDAIEICLGALAVLVDTNTGQALQMRLSQRVAAYQQKLTATQAKLDAELKRIRASLRAGGVLKPLVQTAPQMPPQRRPVRVDPNDPYYTGSPYFPLPEQSVNG
jgi:hypothetical protein